MGLCVIDRAECCRSCFRQCYARILRHRCAFCSSHCEGRCRSARPVSSGYFLDRLKLCCTACTVIIREACGRDCRNVITCCTIRYGYSHNLIVTNALSSACRYQFHPCFRRSCFCYGVISGLQIGYFHISVFAGCCVLAVYFGRFDCAILYYNHDRLRNRLLRTGRPCDRKCISAVRLCTCRWLSVNCDVFLYLQGTLFFCFRIDHSDRSAFNAVIILICNRKITDWLFYYIILIDCSFFICLWKIIPDFCKIISIVESRIFRKCSIFRLFTIFNCLTF